jgi:hypothetical protein
MKNFDFFVWASDYEQFRGEGLLARKFIQSLFFNSKFNLKIQTNSNSYIFFRNKSILTKKKKLFKRKKSLLYKLFAVVEPFNFYFSS